MASSNSTAAPQDPACTRDPRHVRCARTRGATRGRSVGGGAERRGSERRRSERRGPNDRGPTQWGPRGRSCRGRAAPAAHARKSAFAPQPVRAPKCAPAKPRRSAATPGGGDPSDADQEVQDDREADEDTRDDEGHDVSGQDRGSRDGDDRDGGDGVGQDGGGIDGRGPWRRPWRRWWPIQPAARGARVVSNYQAGEGRRAAVSRGQTARRKAGAGAESPCIRRESVALVMLVAGRCRCQRARSARR